MLQNDVGTLLIAVQFQMSLYDGSRPVYIYSPKKVPTCCIRWAEKYPDLNENEELWTNISFESLLNRETWFSKKKRSITKFSN